MMDVVVLAGTIRARAEAQERADMLLGVACSAVEQQGAELQRLRATLATERESWAGEILGALAHDMQCAFKGCTCGAAARECLLYAKAAALIRGGKT